MRFESVTKDGQPLFRNGKPVYLNTETGQELEIDVDKLFAANSEARAEAQRLRQEAEEAKTRLEAWGELEPEAVRQDLEELSQLRQGRPQADSEEVERQVEAKYGQALRDKDAALKKTQQELKKSEKTLTAREADYNQLLLTVKFDEAIASLEGPGINPALRDDVHRRLGSEFTVEKGNPVLRDQNGALVMGTDPQNPMTPSERLKQLVSGEKKAWLVPPKGSPHVVPPEDGSHRDLGSLSIPQLFQAGLETPNAPGS